MLSKHVYLTAKHTYLAVVPSLACSTCDSFSSALGSNCRFRRSLSSAYLLLTPSVLGVSTNQPITGVFLYTSSHDLRVVVTCFPSCVYSSLTFLRGKVGRTSDHGKTTSVCVCILAILLVSVDSTNKVLHLSAEVGNLVQNSQVGDRTFAESVDGWTALNLAKVGERQATKRLRLTNPCRRICRRGFETRRMRNRTFQTLNHRYGFFMSSLQRFSEVYYCRIRHGDQCLTRSWRADASRINTY